MNLIRISIERPIAVIAVVLMVLMLGLVALFSIPIQLSPEVRKPVITVNTNWGSAAPEEFEREITNRQEEKLKGVEGLKRLTSASRYGSGEITLEFEADQNMDRALLLTANRLDQVEEYPLEAEKPSVSASSSEDSPIAWLILKRLPGNPRDMSSYGDFAEDVVKARLERVRGVSRSNIFGGSEEEIRVVVSPERMARYRLTVPEIVATLRANHASISAGDVEEGKRRYVVRTEGELDTVEKVKAVVLRSDPSEAAPGIARVTVGDIADVEFTFKKPRAHIRHLGEPAIALNCVRESGTNVIEVMDGIRKTIDDMNRTVMAENGLQLIQVYDETVYINSAMSLVTDNIYIGGLLASFVLLLFLRSWWPTIIIALAIPISVIGSFAAMEMMGRTINVISLAGLAFAVGMVVDAAIVVLENIYRLRQEGRSLAEASYEGARQVWGAILNSSLTTVLVFLPILTMSLEVGQLFRDIAVAITMAILLSLVVSITVIPALANRLLTNITPVKPPAWAGPWIERMDSFAAAFTAFVLDFTRKTIGSARRSWTIVGGITAASLLVTFLFLPRLEYLPEGNRNLIFGVILPPPGYNLPTTTAIANRIENAVRPLWASETGPESKRGAPPKIDNFFFVARSSEAYVGASSVDPERVAELIPVLNGPVFEEPGTFGFISQPSLFARATSGGRTIELNITGPNLEQNLSIATKAVFLIEGVLPRAEGTQLRPRPGLELGSPQVEVNPDPIRLADNAMSTRDLGQTLDAFNDGLRVAEVTLGGRRIDLTLQGPLNDIVSTQDVGNLPVVTPAGKIVPAASLANIATTAGPMEIRHLERERTVTLEIRPQRRVALETAIDLLEDKVIEPLKAGGLPAGVSISLTGTADELAEAWGIMKMDLLLALFIVYLVMAILLESFAYPLVILFSVPLATGGAVLALGLLNLFVFQALDMLTLLGFVILIGTVVNNAILIVHQTLHHIREEKMGVSESIVEAAGNRIRPIFMTSLTTIFGMLPLVLFPGAGSELYRGLGTVILGGLALSSVLTLLIIPPLLSLFATYFKVR